LKVGRSFIHHGLVRGEKFKQFSWRIKRIYEVWWKLILRKNFRNLKKHH
jgi:hypothetical protein